MTTPSSMLDSFSPPGKGGACPTKCIFPVRFAVTAEKPGTFLPASRTCPEKTPTFAKHGVTLRVACSGFIFLRWDDAPKEEMAVFSVSNKGFTLLESAGNCTGGAFISIPKPVEDLYMLYVRIPDVDMEGQKDRTPLWRRMAKNLRDDPFFQNRRAEDAVALVLL